MCGDAYEIPNREPPGVEGSGDFSPQRNFCEDLVERGGRFVHGILDGSDSQRIAGTFIGDFQELEVLHWSVSGKLIPQALDHEEQVISDVLVPASYDEIERNIL